MADIADLRAIALAWPNKAPKKLVTARDAESRTGDDRHQAGCSPRDVASWRPTGWRARS